jgi:hypothetical protein
MFPGRRCLKRKVFKEEDVQRGRCLKRRMFKGEDV